MKKQISEGMIPDDFTPKSAESFDIHALSERSRKNTKAILNKIQDGTLEEHDIDDADMNPGARAFLHLINNDDFNLDNLNEEYHNEFAWELLDYDESLLIDKLFCLSNLDKDIAVRLIEKGYEDDICENLDSFKEKDKYDLILNILSGENYETALENLYKIDDLDYSQLFDDLEKSKADLSRIFNIIKDRYFENIDYNPLLLKLIESGQSEDIVENLENLEGLNEEVAKLLIKEGYTSEVSENESSFNEDINWETL